MRQFSKFFNTDSGSFVNELSEVRKEQDQAELIVSWCQFLFSIFILLTWLLSVLFRKTEPDYGIIPFLLGPYIFFSILKISWARRRLVNDAVLVMSVFVDVALITGIIWLFHIQYDQLAGFYLKAPSFVYYFFFISIRTLRYETKYIILTGVTSTISWCLLLYYATRAAGNKVTNSFVQYINSSDILIGAEVEKIIGILVVTAAVVISVFRKKKLLQKSIDDAIARKNLTQFFSEEVAEEIYKSKDSLKSGAGTTRYAAILMIDIRDFTKITQGWSPQDILKLISEYQDVIVPVILKHNGCIDKYMGDGIFAHFGAAKSSLTFAKDALLAMEEILLCCEQWNEKRSSLGRKTFSIGQGAASGDIIFGTTGEKNRLEFTTIGETVNIAAKLERYTKTLSRSNLITSLLYNAGKEQGYVSALEVKEIGKTTVDGLINEIDLVSMEQE